MRFRTDSPILSIRAKLAYSFDMNHMPRAGSEGFDSYCSPDGDVLLYNKTVQPNRDQTEIEALLGISPKKGSLCDWLVNFPLYGGVESVEIGIVKGSRLEAPTPHRHLKPVVFYGSSITNCGSAGRPGLVYPSIVARRLDFPLINMGLSGSCRGELCIADTIAELDIAALVLEFDHNAPTPEFLESRHEPFFRRYRSKRPDTPVLILSKCDFYPDDTSAIRRQRTNQ